jgi:hypothetical protein
MSLTLSAHQPAYLPWLGYFDKILRSDVFVFLDSVQFEKNSFVNRNRVKTANGPLWLTIPVKMKGHLSSDLTETRIDNSQNWCEKHLKTLSQSYRKAPYFEERFPKLQAFYEREFDLLSELCFEQLHFWLDELGLGKPKILRSSSLGIASRKSDLVLDLCRSFSATHYISGALGRDYLETERFHAEGISVEFQSYRHPAYRQLYGEFAPYMGIVDFWLNGGDPSTVKCPAAEITKAGS